MPTFGINFESGLRITTRAAHIVAAMLMFTLLVLECFFQLDKNVKLTEDPSFKRAVNLCGMSMIGTGILLTSQMRRADATPGQNTWLAYFPPKLFMGLLLTPISDKLAMLMVGFRVPVTDDEGVNSLFDMTSDWKQTIRMFRLGLMCMLFGYSAYLRQFREAENNFVDSKGLARMLDRFLRRSPQLNPD